MRRKLVAACVGLSLLLAVSGTALAQQGPQSDQTYKRGRVIMKDLTQYEAQDIRFSRDTLLFIDARTGKELSVPLTDVEYVSRKKSKALLGALTGGALGAFNGLLAWALPVDDNTGTITVGIIAGGTAVGAFIGSNDSSEKGVWEKGRFRISLAVPLTIQGSPRGSGLTLARMKVAF